MFSGKWLGESTTFQEGGERGKKGMKGDRYRKTKHISLCQKKKIPLKVNLYFQLIVKTRSP